MDLPRQPIPGVGLEARVNVDIQPTTDVQPSQSGQSLRPPKRRRSHASLSDCCRTCRLRKVKCSGNPGGAGSCSNCVRLELLCSFNDTNNSSRNGNSNNSSNNNSNTAITNEVVPLERVVSRTAPSRSHTEAGTLRKRAQRACTECHSHKTRCSGDYPRCKRCEASNLTCEYAPAKRKFQHVPATINDKPDAQGSPQSSMAADAPSPENGDSGQPNSSTIGLPDLASLVKENILANKDLLLRHIDAYFEYLYFMPCLGFIHRETVYKQFEEGQLHASRAAGICSVSAFFVSSGPEAVAFASKCSMQVEFHIFCNLGSLKETNLYLYAFDILHNHMSGKYAKCWQLMAVACRLMIGLQLNWEVPGSTRPFKEQECARRLAWQIFHFDRLIAGGFDAYICCREDNMKIRLPCPEDAFDADKEVFVERLQDKPAKGRPPPGLHGCQVRLLNIRHHVLTTSKEFASGPAYLQRARWEPSKVMEDIRKLQVELSRFGSSLPAYLKLSDQNLSRWVNSPERQVFVLLHGLYCTTYIDLYRFSLPGIRERGTPGLLKKLPHDFILKSQKQAIAHAITLARFWETVYNETWSVSNGRAVLIGDYSIAQCVQQCIKVLITAKQHKLYRDLSSHSTAPPWRNEPVDEGSIRPLIDVCLRVLEPWSRVIPSVKPQFDEVVKMVNEFDRTSIYEEETTNVELIAGDGSHPIRLPGAHQLLETVYLAQREKEDTPVHPAIAARFYSAAMNADYSHDPYTGLDAPDNDWQSDFCPPGMPTLLAEARGLPLEQPSPTEPRLSATMGPPAGPEDSAPAPTMKGGYSRRTEMLPAGQGSGLPIMTVGQLAPAHYTESHPPERHQQVHYSGHQNELPHQNFAAPIYDTVQMGDGVFAHQPQGYPQ